MNTTTGELDLSLIKGFTIPPTAYVMPRNSNPPEVRACIILKKYYPHGIKDTRDYSKVVEIIRKVFEGEL